MLSLYLTMFRLYAILLFLPPVACFAQYTISRGVFNADSKKPVADAGVFVNNAIAGGKTNDKGTFILTNVRPVQHDLVVSVIGFETRHQVIMVSRDLMLPVIEIQPKTIMLAEVCCLLILMLQ